MKNTLASAPLDQLFEPLARALLCGRAGAGGFLLVPADEEEKLRRKISAKFDKMMRALYRQQGAQMEISILAEEEVQ